MSHPRFSIAPSPHGHFTFHLTAANGKIILSSERYNSHSGAKHGAESVRHHAILNARYERRTSRRQEPYFVLLGFNGEVIGTSEMYSSAAARDEGIAIVKDVAPGAPIEG